MNVVTEDDDGLSLVELIIYVVVLGLVLAGISAIFVNTWKAQQAVASQTEATGHGQLMATQIERAVRNATAVQVSDGGVTPSEAGPVLTVSTALPGDEKCQAFSFVDGQARMTMSSSAITTAPGSWPLWQAGIVQDGSTAVFTQAGRVVSYAFDIDTDSARVRFVGEIAQRNPSGASECW